MLQEIANDILAEQTPKRLFAVRGKMYELLVNCIPPELILKKLMLELVRKLDDELKHKVADCAAFFEHRLQASCHYVAKLCNGTYMHTCIASEVRRLLCRVLSLFTLT